MNKIAVILGLVVLAACSSKKGATTSAGVGDTRTKQVVLIDDNTYYIVDTTNDKT